MPGIIAHLHLYHFGIVIIIFFLKKSALTALTQFCVFHFPTKKASQPFLLKKSTALPRPPQPASTATITVRG